MGAWALVFRWSGFDQVFLIFSVMALICGPGLGSRVGNQPSAYSIFNRGQRHLLGELRAEQIDAEQRGDHYLAGGFNAAPNLVRQSFEDDDDSDEEPRVVR